MDVESAKAAVKQGWQAAFVVSGLTAVVSIIAIVNGPFMGYEGWNLIDAAFAAIIGWRIMHFSRSWAVVGVLYWAFNIGMP